MGHVPTGPVPEEGSSAHVQRREHRRTGAGCATLNRRELAAAGESLAARFLMGRRAHLVARNVRVGRGEIDLVVAFGELRVAIEVKTVQTGGLDDPSFAFTRPKAAQVRRLANRLGIPRVDLVAISIGPSGVAIRWVPDVA
ncbi:MAG TPA: YraN family protein [Acidimicrobiia bacterium]|nr:YraN family protein [Acidimicrobiia bacterium]